MVPAGSLIMIVINAILGIGVPIVLAWWLVKKYKVNIRTILIGAAVFILFALVLETIMHQIVLKGPHGATITGNIWYYALYGGLAAGIFEETGRFLAMKFLLKKEPTEAKTAVAYGVGHGGVEMMIIFGLTMISNLAIAAMINGGQTEMLLGSAPAEARAQVEAQFAQLEMTTAGTYLLGLWERISALILQIGLSVVVWTAVRKGGKWLWLFPAAILLHFLVDGAAVVLAKSASAVVVEIIVFCIAIAVGAMGLMLAKKLTPEQE
jgi:uncharacterized membrane protein YhfC